MQPLDRSNILFRWGIMSTAKIAREHVIPAIMASDNGVVFAIASRDVTKAQALADKVCPAEVFGSYKELLACPNIDGVYIPLPTSEHVAWAIRAADAGKHVLVEKPLAVSAASIAPVIEARDRNRVLISEAFMITYHPQWQQVLKWIKDETIGKLRHVQGCFSYLNRDPQNIRNKLNLGGGGLSDIGVYPIVATRFATGAEPLQVQATMQHDEAFGTDVYSSVRVDFGAFELSFYISTQLASRQSMIFHGDRGFIELRAPFNAGSYDDARVELHDAKHIGATVLRFPNVNQYRLQVESFVRETQGGHGEVFTLESSVANQTVVDAVRQAAEAKVWVNV
jgi:predicted dehydrogenase